MKKATRLNDLKVRTLAVSVTESTRSAVSDNVLKVSRFYAN